MATAKSLSALLAQTSLDDHDDVLKAANAAIKKSKADLDAHHVKAVALLKLERYEDAVKVFEDVPALQEKARFEYAYALYRSGNATKAVQVAGADESSRGMKHVLAQAAYRSEDFAQAATVYKQISKDVVQDEEYDLRINSGAVDAQLEWSGQGHLAQKKKATREDLEVFETAYNAACGSVSRGDLAQGEYCLKRAKALCNALSELSDAEKQAEILPITVQQVYVLTQLGRIDEAEELSTTIPFSDIKELSTRYLAQVNNIAASKEHTNPYLSHRLFHASPKPPKTDQHFSFQSVIIRQDEYAVSLLAHKFAGVTSSTGKLISAAPAPTTSPTVNTAAVLNAAAHARNAVTEKAALKEVLPLLEKRPNDVGLLLTIMNLYVLTNNHAAATHLLESFFRRLEQSGSGSDLDVRFAPGLVAALVSLYAHQGRHSASKNELAKAAEYWRKPHKSETNTPSKALMTAAGTALLESQNNESLTAAGEIFGSLYAQDKTDRAAIAGLVAAYSLTNPTELPSELVDSLPQVERLVQDTDAAALEDAGVPSVTPTSANIQSEVARKRAAESKAPVKAKRIRKSRMPKDFDPNKKMDLERWLPMRDRTYYRPKGKKGKKKAEGLTQGGAVAEEKAPATEVKTAGGVKGAKKKKGKGGKW
ncbi:hypothetical protein K505DRAFT_371580 [Melanomma pulvis-pyrius CBS 109.77]|uniref:Signal recognition particle subunit SRP72 n=1 Tax=Melanomma pulvis-pyrius CBS 109.77 TaxID=1314802 RepID=A0A6A6XPX4_9PLEO|nr:hypothetical protein K505DRAFT_371580 [Melanomma pulvis-pyrius CBS 109.77]